MEILKNQKEINAFKTKYMQDTCPLCGRKMKYVETKNRVLDHDHSNGCVRSVICRNCNGIEGKIHNLCIRAGNHVGNSTFLRTLADYWDFYSDNPSMIIHPTFGKSKKRVVRRRKKV